MDDARNSRAFQLGLKERPHVLADRVAADLATAIKAFEFKTVEGRAPRFSFGVVLQTGPLEKPVPHSEFFDLFAPQIVNGLAEQIAKDMGNAMQLTFGRLEAPPGAIDTSWHESHDVIVRCVPFFDGMSNKEFVRIDVLYG